MPRKAWSASTFTSRKTCSNGARPGGCTLLQLRNEARQRGLNGRSTMNKAQLDAAPLRNHVMGVGYP